MGWISIDDRLPDEGVWVNLRIDTSAFEEAWPLRLFNDGKDKLYATCGKLRYVSEDGYPNWERAQTPNGSSMGRIEYVTHWQPLPSTDL
jgi:hypothetical protein